MVLSLQEAKNLRLQARATAKGPGAASGNGATSPDGTEPVTTYEVMQGSQMLAFIAMPPIAGTPHAPNKINEDRQWKSSLGRDGLNVNRSWRTFIEVKDLDTSSIVSHQRGRRDDALYVFNAQGQQKHQELLGTGSTPRSVLGACNTCACAREDCSLKVSPHHRVTDCPGLFAVPGTPHTKCVCVSPWPPTRYTARQQTTILRVVK